VLRLPRPCCHPGSTHSIFEGPALSEARALSAAVEALLAVVDSLAALTAETPEVATHRSPPPPPVPCPGPLSEPKGWMGGAARGMDS